MSDRRATGDRGWLASRAEINVVSIAALSGMWLAVHEALLSGMGSWSERAYLQLIVVTQSVWLVSWTAVTVTFSRRAGLRRVARASMAASFVGPGVLYLDALLRVRTGQDLAGLVPIALDTHADDSRRILEATGIDARVAIVFFVCAILAAVVAAWVDVRTEPFNLRIAERIPYFTIRSVCLVFLGGFAALAGLERGASHALRTASWLRFDHAVPQVLGILGPAPGVEASMWITTRAERSQLEMDAAIARLDIPAIAPSGDVFFFVADSLRSDAPDPILTPTFWALAADALPIDVALSGGNATHLGWYSLFRSDSALAWRPDATAETARGAVPLQLARRRGWRIEVLSTPNLHYMNLDRSILGEGNRLADAVLDLHDRPGGDGALDAQIVDELIRRTTMPHAPTAYLVFLDSTHLPYSWGDDFVPPVRPFAGPRHYVRILPDPSQRALVVARYRNAVAFVDSLLGRFVRALRASGRYDDATVVVTGDHGEEFWEHGLAGHGSDLSRVQTRVTLLLKLPKQHPADGDWSSPKALARTIDIWPTILDASGVRGDTTALFDGVSLARRARRTAVIAGQRYWYPPSRFVLDDGERRVLFELTLPDDRARPQRLDVLSLLDSEDAPTHPDFTPTESGAIVREWFGSDLDRLFTVAP